MNAGLQANFYSSQLLVAPAFDLVAPFFFLLHAMGLINAC